MDEVLPKTGCLDNLPRPASVESVIGSRADQDIRVASLAAHIADNSVPPEDKRTVFPAIAEEQRQHSIIASLLQPINPDVAVLFTECLFERLSRNTLGDLRSVAAEIADLRADLVALGPDGQLVAVQAKRWSGSPSPRSGTVRESRDGLRERLLEASAVIYLHPPECTADYAGAEVRTQTACLDIVTGANLPTDGNQRALPAYAVRPYLVRQCCLATPSVSLPSDVGSGSRPSAVVRELAWARALASATMRFTVAFSDQRFFQNYKAGLLQLLDALLASLLRMLVVLLTALAHQATTPAFLLVMLRSIRHYGHRGEPDHLLLFLVLTFDQQQRAVRLAA